MTKNWTEYFRLVDCNITSTSVKEILPGDNLPPITMGYEFFWDLLSEDYNKFLTNRFLRRN